MDSESIEKDNDNDNDFDIDDEDNPIQDFSLSLEQEERRRFEQLRSNAWVLVVDDEEAIRQAVGQLLSHAGYHVTACANAMTALQVMSSSNKNKNNNNNVPPDCVVTDVRMPGMDGLQLVEHMRRDKETVQIPVVMLTAKGMTQDRIQGYNVGVDAYLSKPFDPDEFLAVVDHVIQRRQTLGGSNIEVEELYRDLQDIKQPLVEKGGAGALLSKGNWVENTQVFLAPDERQVLELLCSGHTTKEISNITYLSTRRVEQLITRMFRKTSTKNRTALVRWAVSTGNVQL